MSLFGRSMIFGRPPDAGGGTLTDHTIQHAGNDDVSMSVTSGDFLLIANGYRSSGAQSAPAPVVDTTGGKIALSGVTSIAASANFDTIGTTRGSGRLDRATAAGTGTMQSNQATDTVQVIMRWSGISGAPVQTARSTADANDSCNISLGSAPSGTVIVVVLYGPGTPSGVNQQPAAPSGWTKLVDHNNLTRGIAVFQADTPQQSFTYSLNSGSTTSGGRDVHIMEW